MNKKNLETSIRIRTLIKAIPGTILFHEKVMSIINRACIRRANVVVQNETLEFRQYFFGILMAQYPNDLITYQALLWTVKPDVIVEIGTFRGGLTHYFSMLLEHINLSAKIVTVDNNGKRWRQTVERNIGLNYLRDRIVFVEGSSVEENTIRQVLKELPPGAKVLVLLDSRHEKEHVLKEINLYSPMVTKGSYLIVNDTHLDGTHWSTDRGPGPLAAVRAFMSDNNEFLIDKSLNRFSVGTAVEDGYLKRIN